MKYALQSDFTNNVNDVTHLTKERKSNWTRLAGIWNNTDICDVIINRARVCRVIVTNFGFN